ncbi:exported hypothetical protein [Vibrio nigripulchritudo MADA3029]|uniref:hypothetical protein n=1 Tax=Vibrio nigripulchritudo TaxID=28173 RepID=UPI0003B1B15D|nr:hypothetical protein [Vibrio nigripulchritudo]CCN50439.1 exported hypothetical protein [Vibrio nigripulchritudo MADA3020]CCN52390.1 exported hypothetical protein [Vibrio nigripulchritudo MADA3021]CCN62217.1 exported hypothetical protein [Vibrio nigripulchritudo MADA3029]
MSLKKALLSAAIFSALAGCGGGGSSSDGAVSPGNGSNNNKPTIPDTGENQNKPLIGKFTDSAVSNIAYAVQDENGKQLIEGLTNEKGEFEYFPASTITFKVGSITLGTTAAKSEVTPVDLPSPTKIAQLLQSIDQDGDPDINGIQVPDSLHGNENTDVVNGLKDLDDLSDKEFKDKLEVILNRLNETADGVSYKFVSVDQAKQHLEKNPVIVKTGGFKSMMHKRLIETPEKLSDGAVFRALSQVEGIENLLDDKPYQFAITKSEGEIDIAETNQKILLINQFEAQVKNLTSDNLEEFRKTLASLTGLEQVLFNQPSSRYIKYFYSYEPFTRNIDIAKTLYRARAMAKVEATITTDKKYTYEDIASDLEHAEFSMNSIIRLYSVENKAPGQDYLLANVLKLENPSINALQSIVDSTNTLASYARSYVKWPAQSRFPYSVVLDTEPTTQELQTLVINAGFIIPEDAQNRSGIDHKPDLILDANDNVLDVHATQRSIDNIEVPGVASVSVKGKNNTPPAVIRNDGSVLSWRIKGILGSWPLFETTQYPVIKLFNSENEGNPVTQLFSNENNIAAIRKDGSVVTWDTGLKDDAAKQHVELDGTSKAVDIAATKDSFAVLRENGSIAVIGPAIDADTQEDLKLSDGKRFVSISSTQDSFAALRNDGAIVSWGNIGAEDKRKLVLALPGEDPQRPQDSANQAALQIVSSQGAFAAIKKDGSVFTWGSVGFGADSTRVSEDLNGSSPIVRLVASEGAFAALRKDGKVVAWGNKTKGGVLQPSTADYPSYLYSDVKNKIFDQSVYEDYGDGKGGIDFDKLHKLAVYSGITMPEDITELETGVIGLYANNRGFTALKENGKHQIWGSEVAVTDEEKQSIDASKITRVWADQDIYVAEKIDGSIVTWGRSFSTERGHTLFPAEKFDGTVKVRDIEITSGTVAALMEDGSVVQWGVRGFVLMSNTTSIPSINLDETIFDGSNPIVELSSKSRYFIALHEDGSVTTWGNSLDGGNSEFLRRELGAQNTNVAYPITDADNDGLDSQEERVLGTSPNVRDSDNDGVPDGVEVNTMGTQPLNDYSKPFESVNGALQPLPEDRLMINSQTGVPASWN